MFQESQSQSQSQGSKIHILRRGEPIPPCLLTRCAERGACQSPIPIPIPISIPSPAEHKHQAQAQARAGWRAIGWSRVGWRSVEDLLMSSERDPLVWWTVLPPDQGRLFWARVRPSLFHLDEDADTGADADADADALHAEQVDFWTAAIVKFSCDLSLQLIMAFYRKTWFESDVPFALWVAVSLCCSPRETPLAFQWLVYCIGARAPRWWTQARLRDAIHAYEFVTARCRPQPHLLYLADCLQRWPSPVLYTVIISRSSESARALLLQHWREASASLQRWLQIAKRAADTQTWTLCARVASLLGGAGEPGGPSLRSSPLEPPGGPSPCSSPLEPPGSSRHSSPPESPGGPSLCSSPIEPPGPSRHSPLNPIERPAGNRIFT